MAQFRDIAGIGSAAITGYQQGQQSAAQAMQNRLAQLQLGYAPQQLAQENQQRLMQNRLLQMQVQEAEQAPAMMRTKADEQRKKELFTESVDLMRNILPHMEGKTPEEQKAIYDRAKDVFATVNVRNKRMTPEEAQQLLTFEDMKGYEGIRDFVGNITGEQKPSYSKDLTVVSVKNPKTGEMENKFAQVRGDGGLDILQGVEVPEDRDQALKELKFQMEQKEKQQAALNSVTDEIDQAGLMIDQAKLARDRTDWTSTGWFAQFTSGLGGTPASELGAVVDSIKAKLGFEELRKMREQSPTGGALGQVTEKELTFLQSVIENLDPERVGPAEFKRKLDNVITRFQRIQRLAQMERDILSGGQFNQDAFNQLDIDPRAEEQVDNLLKVVSGQQGKSDMSVDDALKMYGD